MIEQVMNMNWTEIAGVAAMFILAFDRLAKLTPTEADNRVVRWLQRLFTMLGVKVEDRKK